MKKIAAFIAGTGWLIVGISLYAWAQGPAPPSGTAPGHGPGFTDKDGDGICDCAEKGRLMQGRKGPGNRSGLGVGAVKLTPEQHAQVDMLKADHHQAVSSLRTTVQTRQEEFDALMKAAHPDQKAINAKIDEISLLRSQLQKEKATYQVSVRNLLTSEQRAALDARGAGAGGRHGRGMGKGSGMRHGAGFVDADQDGVCDHCESERKPAKQ